MTIRLIRLLLVVAMLLVGFGAVFGGGATLIAAAGGHAERTSLPLKIEGASPQPVLARNGSENVGELLLDHGTLNVHAGGAGYAIVQVADIAIACGLWLLILAATRQLVGQVGAGSPFEPRSVGRLRRVGWSLIALNLWGWMRMVVAPPLLLSQINPVVGNYRIMPSISQGAPGLLNARVDTSLGIGLLAAGVIILVLAQAFQIGGDLRADNEAIV
jgi:hypothetical protein